MLPANVHDLPQGPGVYQLRLRLPEPARIRIGALGTFDFPAGAYVYTGSAMGGLKRRLARHLRTSKTLHWHIDYLLQHAEVVAVFTHPTRDRTECELHQQTLQHPNARVIIRGFGSSDCRCASHLVYIAPNAVASPRG